MVLASVLPQVPAKHNDFITHVAAHSDTPLRELVEPYKQYDTKLREVFAQEPTHPALADQHLNITPVFSGQETHLNIRARNLAAESEEEKDKYLMPLAKEQRKPNGSPAIVQSFKEFQTNFNLFSESSLVDMDWSNVVAAGSSVVTPLLPVPEEYSGSKRALRQYYHEVVAPASDVDLFIYGLTEEEAIEKIKQIETKVKDAILEETTTIRTKHAITIASQYPTRHVQIVLRIYKSIAEILTGFDVDCSCAAYDGKQVYAAPRALASYMTQTNTIDLTRRSPSYENRLSKYSRRGFEVYWPQLDRSRIDPTIFERNFTRTVGLARLLVLEKLPTQSDRDAYMDQRRRERGRPAINRYNRYSHSLRGNIKERYEDEVAEWVEEDEVADYHTFTIPYGEKFHARKIEKLLYTKDLLLNAEWNKPEDREVNLHRHPAFFGNANDVIYDCCGYCPKPHTPEEEEVAEEESKIYVSGNISFIKDDPGRQSIGSFNPITDDDWTEMAYVGNTARLCQAIVDGDFEHVQDWLAQEGSDPNCRDYTGRTPLHLAALSSTSEIVQALVDAGARMVARLADGRTALHIAAARGNVEMVKTFMKKSEENEEEEARKEDIRKQARIAAKNVERDLEQKENPEDQNCKDDNEDAEMIDADDDVEMKSATTGSYVKVKKGEEKKDEADNLPEEDDEEPDVYDINVLAWDTPCSPLHLAIINGHCDVVKELVQNFGADVLLPVKLLHDWNKSPRAAILTIVLATRLPLEDAQKMTRLLLDLGASSAQADLDKVTALHRFVTQKPELMQTLIDHDRPATQRAINHLSVSGSAWSPGATDPLMSAIEAKNPFVALQLLDSGAKPEVDFSRFMDAFLARHERYANQDAQRNQKMFRENVQQPIILAAQMELPEILLQLLHRGADPNTLTTQGWNCVNYEYRRRDTRGQSLLDVVCQELKELRNYDGDKKDSIPPEPSFLGDGREFIDTFEDGCYKQWVAVKAVQNSLESYESRLKAHKESVKKADERKGLEEKRIAVEKLLQEFENVEKELLSKGAKTFYELYPSLDKPKDQESSKQASPDAQGGKPWTVQFGFRVPDLTEKTKEGYLDLYEAAWKGDLSTIKAYTLAMWGVEHEMLPLKIAVQDDNGLSPFHIAILRGHLDIAKAILEIVQAQYLLKEDKQKERYTMNPEYSDEESETSDDEDGIQIYKEIVDDKFTIDDIGEVSSKVKSGVSPIAVLGWNFNVPWAKGDEKHPRYDANLKGVLGLFSHPRAATWKPSRANNLIQFAIQTDDQNLLRALLKWGTEYTLMYSKPEDEDASRFYAVSDWDFQYAMERGRTRCLAEIIKAAGTGIPMEHLIKKSGVEIERKPRYYQGLSIHGKKRADWAAAGRGMQPAPSENKNPPLLLAAYTGNLESVEWFLSDAPERHYGEFAEANKEDKRVQNMAKIGFDRAIHGWLGTRHDLVIHCVVMSKPKEDTLKLLDYLIRVAPKSVETKSSTGQTPLHLAFSLGRCSIANRLVAAGADQTTRDHAGNNILHAALSTRSGKKPEQLFAILSLIDTRLLESLFTERSSAGIGGVTPLSRWIHEDAGDNKFDVKVLQHLLSLSPTDEHLELVNGAGDTPLHVLVQKEHMLLMSALLDRSPALLYRENSTGRTPAEMAYDNYMAECFQDPPALPRNSHAYYSYNYGNSRSSLLQRSPDSFVSKDDEEQDGRSQKKRVWDLCCERMEQDSRAGGMKRKLVSLGEANEVARRLAKRKKRETRDEDAESEADEKDDGAGDEVASWLSSTCAWVEE